MSASIPRRTRPRPLARSLGSGVPYGYIHTASMLTKSAPACSSRRCPPPTAPRPPPSRTGAPRAASDVYSRTISGLLLKPPEASSTAGAWNSTRPRSAISATTPTTRPASWTSSTTRASNWQRMFGGARTLDDAQRALEQAGPEASQPLSQVKLHAPSIYRPRVACAGGNYAKHAAGALASRGEQVTEEEVYRRSREGGPWGFWKVIAEFAADGDQVIYPSR